MAKHCKSCGTELVLRGGSIWDCQSCRRCYHPRSIYGTAEDCELPALLPEGKITTGKRRPRGGDMYMVARGFAQVASADHNKSIDVDQWILIPSAPTPAAPAKPQRMTINQIGLAVVEGLEEKGWEIIGHGPIDGGTHYLVFDAAGNPKPVLAGGCFVPTGKHFILRRIEKAEEPMPCPYCGETVMVADWGDANAVVALCHMPCPYIGPAKPTNAEATSAHNEVCRAIARGREAK